LSEPGWRARVSGWLRPAASPKAGPPSVAVAEPPARARPPGPAPRVAVTVLGLSGEALERVVEIAERQCAETGARPVFVTDGHDFAPFRRRRLVVDQVVDAEVRAASSPGLAWRLYRRRQYALLAARWRPAAVISFGRQPDEDCLEALRGGPTPAAG
jgi:hypothetical protein